MRWFKHMTQTRADERIASLISECGMEGYGAYWAVLEIVANVMDKTSMCEVTYPLTIWSSMLLLHHNRVRSLLGNFDVMGLMKVSSCEGKVTVKVPNLLKYRDEYSKKSGQNPDKLRIKSGATPEQDTETETETDTDTDIKELTKVNSLSGKPDDALFLKNKILKKEAIEVLDFLNEKTGKKYRPSETNLKFIISRLKSGGTVSNCRMIIAKKYRDWKDDPKMINYVRPATLFNATKFEQYLGELV